MSVFYFIILVHFFSIHPVGIICNEEGKLIGLEPNRVLRDEEGNTVDIIFGTFIVAGLTEDDFGSLTDMIRLIIMLKCSNVLS